MGEPLEASGAQQDELFVISVCDGVGAIFLALRKLQLAFRGVAFENDPALAAFVEGQWENVLALVDVLQADVGELVRLILASKCRKVWLVGAPPCAPFSALGSAPAEFADGKAQPLSQFFRIRDHLQQYAKQHGWTYEYLLEEVASMDRPSRLEISRMAACEPVLLHAADFGYVHRPRLYWGLRQEHLRTRAAVECTVVQGKSEPFAAGQVAWQACSRCICA